MRALAILIRIAARPAGDQIKTGGNTLVAERLRSHVAHKDALLRRLNGFRALPSYVSSAEDVIIAICGAALRMSSRPRALPSRCRIGAHAADSPTFTDQHQTPSSPAMSAEVDFFSRAKTEVLFSE